MIDKYYKDDESKIGDLLRQCRQRKRSAQHQLFQIFYNYAMSIARRYVSNTETAEEVVNDAFFKVFTKVDLYEESLPFRFWLRRIVINTAIDRLRSTLKTHESGTHYEQQALIIESSVVEDLTREQILAALDRLPPAYRTVFNLFVVDGFSHEEIAQMLNISSGTSKSNLARARQHLRALFSDDFEFKK